MKTSPRARLVLMLVVLSALGLAAVAVALSIKLRDPIGPIFSQVATVKALAALIVWAMLAWFLRRHLAGNLENLRITSRIGLLWGWFRVVLLVATLLGLVVWPLYLALSSELAPSVLRAFVLLALANFVASLAGGAVVNSALVWRHVRTARG